MTDAAEGAPAGIDAGPVTAWLADRGLEPPLRFAVIEGGRSNLTYRVADATGREVILRRPPLHGVLESAHDVGREHRIIAALARSRVPVPATVGFEPDPAVAGAPFYVMEAVEGLVVRDTDAAHTLPHAARAGAAEDLVAVLARLHDVAPDAVGLGDLGRRDGYAERQLKRWHRQVSATRTRDLPVLDEVHARLAAAPPVQDEVTVVHGDYRLDNVIVDPRTGQVRAVLDWELTTLGDPRADVGLLHVYWTEDGDTTVPLPGAPTLAPGFGTRDELSSHYAAASGRDLAELPYFVALGYWKLACILEGVHSRFASGAYGEGDGSHRAFGELVIALAERAADATAAAGR